MKFEDIYGRFQKGRLSCEEAAELLGMSERSFRRWRERFHEEGEEGLWDRRVGKASARQAPVDEVAKVLDLYRTRYFDFRVRHFHEKLPEHGVHRSYTWTKNVLQGHGLVRKAPRRGAHRRRRPRRPLPGMMLHQDGSTHEWVAGEKWDLIATMDDATSEIYSLFFVEEEGTWSTFRALDEVLRGKGLFTQLYADRASHYWHTPEAGGRVDPSRPTQVKRALDELGIELVPAYSPEARGRSERTFGTLQNRLPQELRLANITTKEEANQFLKETYLPNHNARFTNEATDEGTGFIPFPGIEQRLPEILCLQEERTVGKDNTVRYNNIVLQIPANTHRHHYVKAKVRVREYLDGTLGVFYGPRRLSLYHPDGTLTTEAANATSTQHSAT